MLVRITRQSSSLLLSKFKLTNKFNEPKELFDCHNYLYYCPTITKRFIRTNVPSLLSANEQNNDQIRYVDLQSNKNLKQTKTKPDLKVIFELDDGRELIGKACDGDTLLDVVINNELDIDGFGACEGTLACSTCHLVFSQEDFDRIPNKITDEEMDMLDLSYGLTETSRLGCQIYMTKEFDGLRVKVPPAVNDVRLR